MKKNSSSWILMTIHSIGHQPWLAPAQKAVIGQGAR
jgi:hypothetical protein